MSLCRDCGTSGTPAICPRCGSRRVVSHPELFSLSIAHIDCDAFFASVEKRDNPSLAARPVLVGGGTRGVVAACCYIARTRGVRSAMPMFKALAACPDAVVVRPNFEKYAEAGRQIRAMMQRLTPLVEPMSIDEAVLDLSGTEALHRAPPAVVLAAFARDVECEVGVTVSIGLAANRLMAKIAAGRDKPRGFAVIGAEAAALLAGEPVRLLPGVGPAMAARLHAAGFTTLGQLGALSVREAAKRFGEDGPRLAARARGEDARPVIPGHDTKSVSAETTFNTDLTTLPELEAVLWRLCERLARRLAAKDLSAGGVTLKLKTAAFASRTRAARLAVPSQVPDVLFDASRRLLAREVDGTAFRLLGIGAQTLLPGAAADAPDLADPDAPKRVARWNAMEKLRERFGEDTVRRGRGLPQPGKASTS